MMMGFEDVPLQFRMTRGPRVPAASVTTSPGFIAAQSNLDALVVITRSAAVAGWHSAKINSANDNAVARCETRSCSRSTDDTTISLSSYGWRTRRQANVLRKRVGARVDSMKLIADGILKAEGQQRNRRVSRWCDRNSGFSAPAP
jgi:hypothetical protein